MINAEVLVDSKRWKKIIINPENKIKTILNKFPNSYKFIGKEVQISILLINNYKNKITK